MKKIHLIFLDENYHLHLLLGEDTESTNLKGKMLINWI